MFISYVESNGVIGGYKWTTRFKVSKTLYPFEYYMHAHLTEKWKILDKKK